MQTDGYALIIYLVLIAATGGAIIAFSSVVGRFRAPAERFIPYECGIDPAGEPHCRFSVKFFLIAVLFIVLDVEIVFLYPWALVFKDAARSGTIFYLAEMLIFLSILGLALLYAWGKGALEWED